MMNVVCLLLDFYFIHIRIQGTESLEKLFEINYVPKELHHSSAIFALYEICHLGNNCRDQNYIRNHMPVNRYRIRHRV